MSNTPSWLSKWGRSPRQDRRVVEDGRFVELGQVHVPEPPPVEEAETNTALEVVHEPVGTFVDGGAGTGEGILSNAPSIESTGRPETGEKTNETDQQRSSSPVEVVPEPTAAPETIDAVAAHVEGSLTVAKIVEALEPLPGDVLTEEQSDALAETLRLPEDGSY